MLIELINLYVNLYYSDILNDINEFNFRLIYMILCLVKEDQWQVVKQKKLALLVYILCQSIVISEYDIKNKASAIQDAFR